MNKETHKTVRVYATMETDLYLNINVPVDIDETKIWDFIHCGYANIGPRSLHPMSAKTDLKDGNWKWQEFDYDYGFDPNAPDFSKEILKT